MDFTDYKVADISLAEFGRKEIADESFWTDLFSFMW